MTDDTQIKGLVERLTIHAANKDNTAFARSTMRECIEVLAAIESRVLVERKEPSLDWILRAISQSATTSHACDAVRDLFTHPTPDDASADHKFAIIKDRHYDGEGLSLWVWDGHYYCGTDGDCLLAHPDGSLDGFDCEWLTHDQLEQRLNADAAMKEQKESGDA